MAASFAAFCPLPVPLCSTKRCPPPPLLTCPPPVLLLPQLFRQPAYSLAKTDYHQQEVQSRHYNVTFFVSSLADFNSRYPRSSRKRRARDGRGRKRILCTGPWKVLTALWPVCRSKLEQTIEQEYYQHHYDGCVREKSQLHMYRRWNIKVPDTFDMPSCNELRSRFGASV